MSLYISNFKRERILWLIVFMILITATVVLFAPASNSKDRIDSKNFWINKTFNRNKYSLIIAGDSRIYRGVSPGEMEKILDGYKGFNVGYSSGGFAQLMVDKIERNIDFSNDDAVIVLGVSPWSLTPEAGANKHLAGELSRKKEELIQAKYFALINSWFAPYSLNEVFKGITNSDEQPRVNYRYSGKGWVASNTNMPDPTKALAHERTEYINNQVSEAQLNDLTDKIKEWQNQNAHVFAFRPPSTRAMEALEDSLSGFNEKEVIEKLQNAGAVWLDFDIDDYFSYDGSHLDEKSAIKLSRNLAVKIKEELKN